MVALVVVDTSALIAILQLEPESMQMAECIERASPCLLSAVSLLEASILAVSRRGDAGVHQLESLIASAGIDVVPFDAEQAVLAREAFERFGKGRHPAKLNFGDCAVYGLAMTRGMPLLAKGDDFPQTDCMLADYVH